MPTKVMASQLSALESLKETPKDTYDTTEKRQ
jgi:hypothetical protein